MPTPPRIMALDVGKARIGVALTDPLGHTVQPLLTVYRKSRGEDLRNLTRLTRQHGVTLILVGNPVHLSGDPSPWSKQVEAFAAELRKKVAIPVDLWDERLSSVAANEILDQAGHQKHSTARKPIIDQLAAVLILESYLQHQQHLKARKAP